MDIIPHNIVEEAEEASGSLIPEKSRDRYYKELTTFNKWRQEKGVSGMLNETVVVLACISSLAKAFKPSSLRTKFSMLKKVLIVNGHDDISRFGKVIAFMKDQNVNYKPKKSKILSVQESLKFIVKASDEFLLCKVILIFGVYVACGRDGLLKLTIDDIEHQFVLFILHKYGKKNSQYSLIMYH